MPKAGCIKKSILRYNSLLEETKELVPKGVENTEVIRFYFDLDHELIGYNTTNRFGYKEFLEAFVHVINLGLDDFEPEMYFTISLCSKGIGLDDIKEAFAWISLFTDAHLSPFFIRFISS